MSTSSLKPPVEQLREVIKHGITVDILDAERAWFLVQEILGTHDALAPPWKTFSSHLASMAVNQITLSACKIFEVEKRQYPLWSIPTALKILSANAGVLRVNNRLAVERRLARAGFTPVNINDEDITRHIANHFDQILPNTQYRGNNLRACQTLDHLKLWRDKRVAHNEMIDPDHLPPVEMNDVWELLALAKRFVGVVGLAYIGEVFDSDDGSYLSSNDARRPTLAFRRLAKPKSSAR
ncbi:MAG TPA: hypothetical protein PLU30_24240 [Verrucomicrobiae bacterium]|nr:hypothetical protein [Verrucomicrobiae bacterium]